MEPIGPVRLIGPVIIGKTAHAIHWSTTAGGTGAASTVYFLDPS